MTILVSKTHKMSNSHRTTQYPDSTPHQVDCEPLTYAVPDNPRYSVQASNVQENQCPIDPRLDIKITGMVHPLLSPHLREHTAQCNPDSDDIITGLGIRHAAATEASSVMGSQAMVEACKFPPVATMYTSYSPAYLPPSNTSRGAIYPPASINIPVSYSEQATSRSAIPHRTVSRNGYHSLTAQYQHSKHLPLRSLKAADLSITDTDQESVNLDTVKSETINPPLPGYPSVEKFDDLVRWYVKPSIASYL